MQPEETCPQGVLGHRADAGDGLGQQRVREQGFFAGRLAGVHIRPARIARGVDDKFRLQLPDVIEQEFKSV